MESNFIDWHPADIIAGLRKKGTSMALNKEKQDREVEQNSETTSQFGLQAATRLHEVGIASNRRAKTGT